MHTTVAELASTLQTVFTTDAEQAARECGLIQRVRKFTGATFVQTLVFAWLDNPHATHEDLAEVAAELGIDISADALGRRLGEKACLCLQEVLAQALHHVIAAQPATLPLLQRFQGVYVRDASTITLVAGLADILPGCGGSKAAQGSAALKVLPQLELSSGSLDAIRLLPGKNAERADELAWAPLPEGALLLEDLGFFNLERLDYYASHNVRFLSRLPTRVCVWDEHGVKHTLAAFLHGHKAAQAVDAWVEVGSVAKLRVRLLAQRMPEAVVRKRQERLRRRASKKGRAVSVEGLQLCCWDVLISNVPAEQLSLREAQVLRRLRWQIELLFKVWKSEGRIDESGGHKPYRVLCEVLAKLLAMVVQHWVSLVAAGNPLQYSQRQAARRVRQVALELLRSLKRVRQLQRVLERLRVRLQKHCRVRSRKGSRHPAAFQTVLNPEHDGIHSPDPS